MSEFKAFGLFRGGKVHRAKCVRFRCVIPSFIHPSIPRVHTREQHVTHTSVRDVCPARAPSGHSPRPARPPPRSPGRFGAFCPARPRLRAPRAPASGSMQPGAPPGGRVRRRRAERLLLAFVSFPSFRLSPLPAGPSCELRVRVATSCPGPLPVPACSLRAGVASASLRAPRAQGRPPPRRRTPTRYLTVLPICVCYLDNFR